MDVTSTSNVAGDKLNAEQDHLSATAPSSKNAAVSKSVARKASASLLEKRRRCREHGRRARHRKTLLLKSLREQVENLRGEASSLRSIIGRELPHNNTNLPELAPCLPSQAVTVTDPNLPDNPIVYVSQTFLEMTGYALDQVLGRSFRFLQGPDTDQTVIDDMRGNFAEVSNQSIQQPNSFFVEFIKCIASFAKLRGFAKGKDMSVCLLNYKADGTSFWNQFSVTALKNSEDKVVNFLGVHCNISKVVFK